MVVFLIFWSGANAQACLKVRVYTHTLSVNHNFWPCFYIQGNSLLRMCVGSLIILLCTAWMILCALKINSSAFKFNVCSVLMYLVQEIFLSQYGFKIYILRIFRIYKYLAFSLSEIWKLTLDFYIALDSSIIWYSTRLKFN